MLKFGLILALLAAPLTGQQTLIDEGFSHFYNLEYDQAIAIFEKAIAENPSSPDLHNHLAQSLIFREMFRNGALESEHALADFRQQIGMGAGGLRSGNLAGMGIVATDLAEKDLAFHPKTAISDWATAGFDQPGDHF